MSKKITFTHIHGLDFFPPAPAIKNIPEWYKLMEEYVGGKKQAIDSSSLSTVKKCIPVFDAMTAGYIMSTQVDVFVTQTEDGPYYSWSSQDAITFHPIEQADKHPAKNGFPYPKWMNPYGIKTDPGYSVLIVPPMHHPNDFFTILPGIVDTDTYLNCINFPFVLKNPKFEGLIPAGLPLAQIIPFKRDSFEMQFGGEKEKKEMANVQARLATKWFNKYKTMFWHRKEYK